MKQKIFLFISILLLLITIGMTTGTLCYQESANISNQTGIDGNCGLNYSGKYKIDIPSNSVYFYINYTYPLSASLSSYISIRYSDIKYNNFTIPLSCYYNNITQFLFKTDVGCDGHSTCSNFYCKNNSGWEFFNNSNSFSNSGSSYNPVSGIELFYPFDGNWDTYLVGFYGTLQYPCGGGNCIDKLYEEGIYWDVCINNWVSNSSCNGIDNETIKTYYDEGNCVNTYNLPLDNGTIQSCCVENFTATTPSCDGVINQTIISYYDNNVCNTTYTLPLDNGTIQSCCVENWIENNTVCNLYNYTIQYYDNNVCNTTFVEPINNSLVIDCSCISNWVQDATACINNINLVAYHDTTNCGNLTVIPPPINNGTYQNCVIQQQMNWNDDIIILAVLFLFILVCTICAIAVHEAFFGIDALLILSMLYVFWHYNYPQILWYVTPFIAIAFLIMWVALWKVRRGK